MILNTSVQKFLEIQVQLRILHWQTKGYARHIAFGKTYSTLEGFIDTYVETAMGKQGRFVLEEQDKNIRIDNLTDVKIVEFLQNIKGFLISLSNELEPTKDSDLLNIRDEMLATINKLAYLLTLE
jgi:DNA-binding ferritin-like protein